LNLTYKYIIEDIILLHTRELLLLNKMGHVELAEEGMEEIVTSIKLLSNLIKHCNGEESDISYVVMQE